ncbi:NfeD family protein [Noviherbaspirillum galbum]|uniref:NfeD family protein n=1 Tax=Noviherbaspirillum galbum TaxID=2709383 RepID=A0A6B3SGM0_9BURK|nr:NfeD family protein [Noviherbaspirillum galbum]NEX59753.1 NfeD family protein [Noviherbaspirillum galbum]
MANWIVWILLAGVLVVLELFTGTFYLLMIALGLAAGGLVALVGAGEAAQFVAAAIVGVAATSILHRTRLGKQTRHAASRNPDVLLDIGQQLRIDSWSERSARASYRGAEWDVELDDSFPENRIPLPGHYVIREIRGSRLIVVPAVHHA